MLGGKTRLITGLFGVRNRKPGVFCATAGSVTSKVTSAIASEGLSNCDLSLITPVQLEPGSANDPANPDHYATDDETFRQFSFERYVRNIDRFPDDWFDVILIDGRSRLDVLKQ